MDSLLLGAGDAGRRLLTSLSQVRLLHARQRSVFSTDRKFVSKNYTHIFIHRNTVDKK